MEAQSPPDKLDPVVLRDLIAIDDTGQLLSNLIDIFEGEARAWIPKMRRALAAGDLEGLRFGVHRFRSTCYNVGARASAEVASKLEANLRGSVIDPELIGSLVEQLDTESSQSAQLLHRAFKERLRANGF